MEDYSSSMYNERFHDLDISQESFLVTGGAGFIGSNLVRYLLKFHAGKVRVLDNFSTGKLSNLESLLHNPALEIIEGDIRDLNTCHHVMQGIHYVAHQAALGSVPRSIDDPIQTNDVNISGFLNVIVSAREAAVKRMIYAASSSTYGDHPGLPKVEEHIGNPLSPYAVTKYVNELYADNFSRVYNFHTIGLRYFNVFGPAQNPDGPYAAVIPLFIKSAIEHDSPFINGDGEQSRDFTFIENVVQANIRALFAPHIQQHEVVNIAFGERTTLNQLWNRVAELAGSTRKPAYREARKGDVRHSLADISKAKHLIGYAPKVSVLDGLKLAVDWYTHALSKAANG